MFERSLFLAVEASFSDVRGGFGLWQDQGSTLDLFHNDDILIIIVAVISAAATIITIGIIIVIINSGSSIFISLHHMFVFTL